MVDPAVEQAWAAGTRADGSPKAGLVDLYVGGVEHAVLHLLVRALLAQGALRPRLRVDDGAVPAAREPGLHPGARVHGRARHVRRGRPRSRNATASTSTRARRCTREFGKMGKSLKNAVSPDDIYRDYGADTLRLYEMFMGPLDKARPWNTADIIGVHRFLQRLWRNLIDEETGASRVADDAGRRRDAPRAAPHDRRGARRHGRAELQHRDRAAVRAEQPPDHGGRRDGDCAARGRGAAGADGRAARAAHRRGAVGAARPHRHAGVRAVPDRRSRAARRGHGRGAGADQRQGAGAHSGARSAPTRPRTRRRRAPTRASPSCSTARPCSR